MDGRFGVLFCGLFTSVLGDHVGKPGPCGLGLFTLGLFGARGRGDDVAKAAFEFFAQLGLGFGKGRGKGLIIWNRPRDEPGIAVGGHWIRFGWQIRLWGRGCLRCRSLTRWWAGWRAVLRLSGLRRLNPGLWLLRRRLVLGRWLLGRWALLPVVFRWWQPIVFGWRTPVGIGCAPFRLLGLTPGRLFGLAPCLIWFTRTPTCNTGGRWGGMNRISRRLLRMLLAPLLLDRTLLGRLLLSRCLRLLGLGLLWLNLW